MQRQLAAGLFFMTGGLMVAYVFATTWIDFKVIGTAGFTYLLTNIPRLQAVYPDVFTQVWLIFLALGGAGFAFGAHVASEKLTTVGTSAWQSRADMRRNKLLGKPGKGFVLAKTTTPGRKGKYLTSVAFPNCLIVAPTGAGKGVGFMYPTLLTFEGSTVTLDVKGENYQTTARWRAAMGDEIYRFAPGEFGENSFRYNPLERIEKLKNYSQIHFELSKIATLFLQAPDAGSSWIEGAIQLFTAVGCVAHEREQFTLGGIYKILSEGKGDLGKHIKSLAAASKEPALQNELYSLASLDVKTLGSYMSVMSTAGFKLWANPHMADMTASSDFSFADIRRKKMSVYFVVSPNDIKPLAGLVRLFFNELVSNIQANKPREDEPYPAMILLDEFHLLGKMSEVADAMTTIRGYNGRIAIITQTIPKLDAIYSYEERLSIQGGAGLKLYMTPSEEMTIEDLSKSCGMTTKRTISKSRRSGLGEKTTISERTDEKPLLTEDEARRLPKDVSILIVNGKQPIKAKAIIHYKDQLFKDILKQQDKLSWDAIKDRLGKAGLRHRVRVTALAVTELQNAEKQDANVEAQQDEAIANTINASAATLDSVPQPRVPQQGDLKMLFDLSEDAFDNHDVAVKLPDAMVGTVLGLETKGRSRRPLALGVRLSPDLL